MVVETPIQEADTLAQIRLLKKALNTRLTSEEKHNLHFARAKEALKEHIESLSMAVYEYSSRERQGYLTRLAGN